MQTQTQTAVAHRPPRLASINDGIPKPQQMQSPSNRVAPPTASTTKPVASNVASGAYIQEEFISYLLGGPCNRFALALKSNLDNEIDWACARLVAATHQAPESWSLKVHAPFLVEAVLSVLERSRKELVFCNTSYKGSASSDVKQTLLSDSGREAMARRARQRAGILATVLFNMAQIGDNSVTMSQDLRVTIECTQWLRGFHSDVGFAGVLAELLDVLDIILPLAPAPAFDSAPVRRWPGFGGKREASDLDALALVETCLWEQLVRVVSESRERKLVIGAVRVLVQAVSWHPQLAREILELPVPSWSIGASGLGNVGEMLNQRLAELILAPDAEMVGACFELLLNMVRLEAMSQALDEELEAFALKAAAAASAASSSNNGGSKHLGVKRRRRARGGHDAGSGGDSGAQTPVFGFRPLSRTASATATAPASSGNASEPTMLPDGLAGLVALVLQQWTMAVSPPMLHASSQPLENPAKGHGDSARNASENRPPTEPELREACTWVLLNYEFTPPPAPLPGGESKPTYVAVTEIFNRYIVAKHGQTAPRIGRALNLSEIVRVVAAVFPKAILQSTTAPQHVNAKAPGSAESLVALYLRPKGQGIAPIPAVVIDPAAQAGPPPVVVSGPNRCQWLGLWLCDDKDACKKWSEESVADIMGTYIESTQYSRANLQQLERHQYFERYLWPNFVQASDPSSVSDTHTLSMVLMVNEKYQQGVIGSVWEETGEGFGRLFGRVVGLAFDVVSGKASVDALAGRLAVAQFLIACFGSLETSSVRTACMGLVTVCLWEHIDDTRVLVEAEYEQTPQLRRLAKHLRKKKSKDMDLLPVLLRDFVAILFTQPDGVAGSLAYGIKLAELLVDLESQLATRRYVNLLVVDHQVVELCQASKWYADEPRFRGMVDLLCARVHFQVSDVSGQALTDAEAKARHGRHVTALQAAAFGSFPRELEPLVLASVAALGRPGAVGGHVSALDDASLRRLAALVGIRAKSLLAQSVECDLHRDGYYGRGFLVRAFEARFAWRAPAGELALGVPVYPDERLLYSALVAEADQLGKQAQAQAQAHAALAVPKLGLQFLSVPDYLSRSFELLRLECAHDIRNAVDDALQRLQPAAGGDGGVVFGGWARMAMPITALSIVDVQRPRLGELAPSSVRADVTFDLSTYTESVRAEWDADVRPRDVLFLAASGVRCVRGCEVERRVDEASEGGRRTLRVALDPRQYHVDSLSGSDVYGALDVVVRRAAQESSFKPVLETVRSLMAEPASALLPAWLAPAFLGYGDPKALRTDDLGDALASAGPERQHRRQLENRVRFTPAQIEAIGAAARPGLTLVVGPPGTGKTDVAVQVVSNLYHAHPRQTILLLTHSNQALNQLFEKIIALDIEPRHLLRLGHGEGHLDADERYNKAGRVESFLDRRSELLDDVQRLAKSLDVPGDFGYTCATARLFFIAHVRVLWAPYHRLITSGQATLTEVVDGFPFARFFGPEEWPTTSDGDLAEAVRVAEMCFQSIEAIFDELSDLQPFELLRTHTERANYLLTNQARIVAMTCTHAAMKRAELVQLGFRYHSVVMEESAQVLDIESFIPLTLQRNSADRLKRLVMIGDHNQLPPVVKSPGLRVFANLEQSLFARMVRLGVPYVELNRQARSRPEIADLYRFRYRGLGDLEDDTGQPVFAQQGPNLGLRHTFQFIDTTGSEESEPSRYFYQNLAEAEYVVALYQFMRLMGYSADRIAILTTYNGQRALIRDVLDRRCKPQSFLGYPKTVATVDQYQGQQSDFVLLSLVRTRAVGHVRDLRRLTVALSRARLGLYVFGCRSVFESCFELQPTMKRLLANGDRLVLCPEDNLERVVGGLEDMGQLVYQMIDAHVKSAI
ncbi:hypothetical protein GGI20_002463 [Coemansia sp. BCRC 34301]|nr:hypothetical protein GGI20_002463 [Coemansia sp. BCRC 34301]